MEVSGKPNEGWMLVIPGTVFLVFIMAILGGPRAFLNMVMTWGGDIVEWMMRFVRSL